MDYSSPETPRQPKHLAESTSINPSASQGDLQNHDFCLSVQGSDTQREALFAKETDNVAQKNTPINIAELRKKVSLKQRSQGIPSPNRQQTSGRTDLNAFTNKSFEDETGMVTFNDEKNMSFGEFPLTTPNLKTKAIFQRARINMKDSMNLSLDTSRKLFESATYCSGDTQDTTNLRLSERYEKYHENKMRLQQENKEENHEEITPKSSQRVFTFYQSEESERQPVEILAPRQPETASRRLRLNPVKENEAESGQVNEGNNQNVSSISIENQPVRPSSNNNDVNQTEERAGILTEQEGN